MLKKQLCLVERAKQEVLISVDVEWFYSYIGIQQIAVHRNGNYLGEWGVHEAPFPIIQACVGDTLKFSMVYDSWQLKVIDFTPGLLEISNQGFSCVEFKIKDSTEQQRLHLQVDQNLNNQ